MVAALLPDRYSRENLRRLVDNPQLARRELFQIAVTVNARVHDLERAFDGPGDGGVDVVAADWDNLLILDACRYDMFADRVDPTDWDGVEGGVDRVLSKGSDSWEFMAANFADRTLHDTVYVTANPHVDMLPDDTFHAVVNLLENRWDDEARTVRPEAVVEEAVAAHERFPNKRLIVHFMQPHFPFLGPTGSEFDHAGLEMHLDEDEASDAPNPWFGLIHRDGIDVEQVIAAYEENLDLVVPHVRDLVGELSGKSVVTGDHGNLIGERGHPVPVRMYGHPRGLHRDELLAVPWLTIESDARRQIVAEEPIEDAGIDERVVEERLKHLGYR